ncbi:hypothetical protein AMTR_s00126p00041860, partial [Amborella trichopoda]
IVKSGVYINRAFLRVTKQKTIEWTYMAIFFRLHPSHEFGRDAYNLVTLLLSKLSDEQHKFVKGFPRLPQWNCLHPIPEFLRQCQYWRSIIAPTCEATRTPQFTLIALQWAEMV